MDLIILFFEDIKYHGSATVRTYEAYWQVPRL